MSSSSNRRSGAVVTFVYTICNILVQLIYVPLLLSSIGQEEYGLYQLIGSVVSYIVSINGILAAGVGRFYCMYKANNDRINMENTLAIAKRLYWVMSAVTMVVMCGIAVAFRFVYQASFSPSQIDECSLMLVVLGVNCVVTMNNAINVSVITANERFLFLRGSQIATLILQPLLVLLLTSLFPSALAVTCVVLAMNALCALVQRFYAANILKASYTYHGWNKALAHGLLGFSAIIVLVTLADQIFWKTDQLLIGYFFGAGPVAVYAIGSQIYTAYMAVGTSISSVFFPHVSELFHHDHDMGAISVLFIKVGRMSLMLCLVILGGFAILGVDFMALWAGQGFFEAYVVALVIMVPFTIDLIQNLGLTILQVMNRYQFRGVVYLCLALFNVVLTIVLLQVFGLIGAAFSTAIAMFVGNGLIMNWYYKAKIGLDITRFWKSMASVMAPEFIYFVLFGVVYWLLPIAHGSWTTFIIAGAAFVIGYLLVLRTFVMNEYEKSLISNILAGKLKRFK
ncbi:oligosaccharide flippase family protein [Collinsella sp. HCP28S3_E12]|uniref:oligosaccharide flippase family protein n=1 Tax=Collinsella sp. HCP28S3_E12 TaxID=3438921 RepID=UPI003F8CC80D